MSIKEHKDEIIVSAYAIARNLLKIAEHWEIAENEIFDAAESYEQGDNVIDEELRQWMLKEYPFGHEDISDLAWNVIAWADGMNEEDERN